MDSMDGWTDGSVLFSLDTLFLCVFLIFYRKYRTDLAVFFLNLFFFNLRLCLF